jgi:hypothetical protein
MVNVAQHVTAMVDHECMNPGVSKKTINGQRGTASTRYRELLTRLILLLGPVVTEIFHPLSVFGQLLVLRVTWHVVLQPIFQEKFLLLHLPFRPTGPYSKRHDEQTK